MERLDQAPVRTGSGGLVDALEEAASACDDFLTGGDLTLSHIHNLSTSPKGPSLNPSPLLASAPVVSDSPSNGGSPPIEQAVVPPLAVPPSPSAASTSSQTSSARGAVSPLPKVTPRKSPRPATSLTKTSATSPPDSKKPRSGSGGLPRVALLAQQAAAKKQEAAAASASSGSQRSGAPPPFRSGGKTPTPPPSRSASSRQPAGSGSTNYMSARSGPPSRSSSSSSINSTATKPPATTRSGSTAVNSKPAWGASNAPKSGVSSARSSFSGTNSRPNSSRSIPAPPTGTGGSPPKPGRSAIPRPLSARGSGTSAAAAAAATAAAAAATAATLAAAEDDMSPRAQLADLMSELAEVKKELGIENGDGGEGLGEDNKKEEESGADVDAPVEGVDDNDANGDLEKEKEETVDAAATEPVDAINDGEAANAVSAVNSESVAVEPNVEGTDDNVPVEPVKVQPVVLTPLSMDVENVVDDKKAKQLCACCVM